MFDVFDLRSIGRVFVASVTMLAMVFIVCSMVRSISITRYQSIVALTSKGYSPEEARCAIDIFRNSEECSAIGGVSAIKKSLPPIAAPSPQPAK